MFKYRLGDVVKNKEELEIISEKKTWGHITGFSKNDFGETILVVKWDNGKEYPVHPHNVIHSSLFENS